MDTIVNFTPGFELQYDRVLRITYNSIVFQDFDQIHIIDPKLTYREFLEQFDLPKLIELACIKHNLTFRFNPTPTKFFKFLGDYLPFIYTVNGVTRIGYRFDNSMTLDELQRTYMKSINDFLEITFVVPVPKNPIGGIGSVSIDNAIAVLKFFYQTAKKHLENQKESNTYDWDNLLEELEKNSVFKRLPLEVFLSSIFYRNSWNKSDFKTQYGFSSNATLTLLKFLGYEIKNDEFAISLTNFYIFRENYDKAINEYNKYHNFDSNDEKRKNVFFKIIANYKKELTIK